MQEEAVSAVTSSYRLMSEVGNTSLAQAHAEIHPNL